MSLVLLPNANDSVVNKMPLVKDCYSIPRGIKTPFVHVCHMHDVVSIMISLIQ